MVADQFEGIDKLQTSEKYGAPNFRKAGGGFAVYGMGQPTGVGLERTMDIIAREGCSVCHSYHVFFVLLFFLSR